MSICVLGLIFLSKIIPRLLTVLDSIPKHHRCLYYHIQLPFLSCHTNNDEELYFTIILFQFLYYYAWFYFFFTFHHLRPRFSLTGSNFRTKCQVHMSSILHRTVSLYCVFLWFLQLEICKLRILLEQVLNILVLHTSVVQMLIDPMITVCVILDRYEWNQFDAVLSIPYLVDNLFSRMSWSIVSKAAERSSNTSSTYSILFVHFHEYIYVILYFKKNCFCTMTFSIVRLQTIY